MNEQRLTLFERAAGSEPARRFLRRMGLDPLQFVIFLRIFRILSERGEVLGSLGVNRFAVSYLAIYAAAFGGLIWTLIAGLPPHLFLMLDLSILFPLIFVTIIREAANALFNPVEASMLAHKPVHAPTYAAAKIAHILIAVLYLVAGLAVYPALIKGFFRGTRWFWPFTHIAAAVLIGLWTAFLICALYGLLRRFVAPHFLKSISSWIQLLSIGAFISIPVFFPAFIWKVLTAQFERTRWTWLPLTWFAEIGLIGQSDAKWRLEWQGFLSIAASVIVIWLGLRGFSTEYFSEGSLMVEGRGRRSRKKFFLWRGYSAAIRRITGSPLGLGSYCFVSKMLRRDWQFRRAMLTQAWLPFIAVLAIVLTVARTGYLPSPVGQESAAHFFPHILGIIVVAICFNLPFTDFQHGSWIYLTAPIGDLRPFAKGVFWALWIPLVGIPHLVMAPFLVEFWGWRVGLFSGGFYLVTVSIYLGAGIALIAGLPFTGRFDESRAMLKEVYFQICWLAATIFPALLLLGLFHYWKVAVYSGIVFTLAALVVVHWSLGELEGEIGWTLHKLKMGPNRIFKGLELE